jgi:hypothetical protein
MEIVIILGGGDAGVLIITPHGIKRVGPIGPDVIRELRAVNSLVHIAEGKEFGDVASRLSANALAHIGKATGTTGASVVFAEDDDILYCGNGLRPGPIPHGGGVQFE